MVLIPQAVVIPQRNTTEKPSGKLGDNFVSTIIFINFYEDFFSVVLITQVVVLIPQIINTTDCGINTTEQNFLKST